MRLLNVILNAPVQLESGGTCIASLGGSLCCRHCSKGFPKVVKWLEAQMSFLVTYWVLAEGWCRVV